MVHNAKTTELRPNAQETARRNAHAAPAFKPVAMPALKAAVRAVRPQPKRTTQHELPPILRKDTNAS
jgi:hypothetical protein